MKIYLCLCAILASAISIAAEESELKITGQNADSTGTMWYQDSVTFSLEGYAPLTIVADVEKGVYPTGAREVHKLGPARFLLLGGYSTGGGRYTTVAMILAGRDQRLVIQDQLEFCRDRRAYQNSVFKTGSVLAVGFQALPSEAEHYHELYDWHLVHEGQRYYPDQIRKWPLTKVKDIDGELIVFPIGESGFLLPNPDKNKAEQNGAATPAKRGG
jgi:hypothetical protein